MMRWLFSLLFLGLLGAVRALSVAGSRLLVVLEDAAEKEQYSVFLGDLEGVLLLSYTLIFLYFDPSSVLRENCQLGFLMDNVSC